MVIVDNSGAPIEGSRRVSSEIAMHLACYRARPDIHACVHAHPPHATAFAVAGVPLDEGVLPEVIVLVGPIALTQYAPAGTAAVGESLQPFLAAHDAFLLGHHGVLTLGRSRRTVWRRSSIMPGY
jgi:L-fuculose-phosphate aldolase